MLPAPVFVPSFASPPHDVALRFTPTQPSWFERNGRKVLGWGAATLLVLAVAGAGAWAYRDRQVADALALVAGETTPAPEIVPYVPPAPEPVPPLVLAKPGSSTPEAAPEMDDSRRLDVRLQDSAQDEEESGEKEFVDTAVKAAPVVAAAAVAAKAAAPTPKAKPAKPAPRKEAERKPKQQKQDVRKADVRKPSATKADTRKTAARDKPPFNTSAAAAAAAPALSQEETLRQCRAAGYHASQCVRRGCVATKFGLACRG
jgi:hypothetical protein